MIVDVEQCPAVITQRRLFLAYMGALEALHCAEDFVSNVITTGIVVFTSGVLSFFFFFPLTVNA